MNHNTEKLVNSMLSFIDDSDDVDDFGDKKANPICWGIKQIFPKAEETKHAVGVGPADSSKNFYETRRYCNDVENYCRFMDPYMTEVNRLMCFQSSEYQVDGSSEYYKEVENYAVFGKDFLDFSTRIKVYQSINSTDMPGVTLRPPPGFELQAPPGFELKPPPGFELQPPPGIGLSTKMGMYSSNHQTLVQPLIYSNQHLSTQYQQIMLGGGGVGMQKYQASAQLLQQQILCAAGGNQESRIFVQLLQQQIRACQSKL